MGDRFGTLGDHSPWGHFGGVWEQQDDFEGVRHRILIDFWEILGRYFQRFLGTETGNVNLASGLFPGRLL